jgi:hypothetical protein
MHHLQNHSEATSTEHGHESLVDRDEELTIAYLIVLSRCLPGESEGNHKSVEISDKLREIDLET